MLRRQRDRPPPAARSRRSSASSASRNSAGGTWRRMRWPAPIASCTMREARVAHARASSCARSSQQVRARPAAGTSSQQPQQLRPEERHRARLRGAAGRPPPAASWLRRLRRSAKRRIASTRSSSVAKLERVDAGVAERRAQLRLAPLRRASAKRLRKPRSCVSTNSCSPVSASWIDEQAEVGQLHLERIVQPHRDRLRAAARAAPSGSRPAGRADEIGDDEHQRAARA